MWAYRLDAKMNVRYYKFVLDRTRSIDAIMSFAAGGCSAAVVATLATGNPDLAPWLGFASAILLSLQATLRLREKVATLAYVRAGWLRQEREWDSLWQDLEDGASHQAVKKRLTEIRRDDSLLENEGASFRRDKKLILQAQEDVERAEGLHRTEKMPAREAIQAAGSDSTPAIEE